MQSGKTDQGLISLSYFKEEESITSARYSWDCQNRGDEPFVILQWTKSGEGLFATERGTYPVPADHAFVAVVPERSIYSYPPEAREPWVFGWLNFYGPMACTLFKAFQIEFGPVAPLPTRGAAAAALRRLRALMLGPEPADRWQMSLQSYAFIMEWWRELAEPHGGAEEGLARAIRFCRDRFREQHGVKEIAHESGMSREHFSRLFAARMKETPAAYLRGLRLREAETFLRDTRLPLREVAMRSGFYSPRHLMRAFQRAYGQNPSEFRRKKIKGTRVRRARG